MKKLLMVALVLGLVFGLSCKKKNENKPESTAGQPGQGNQQMPMPEGKIIAPEKFFQFELDKMAIIKDHESSILQLLKAAKNKESALAGMRDANRQLTEKAMAMTSKAEITPFDYRKTVTDPAAQKANEEYIMNHMEINEKLRQFQNEIRSLDQSVKNELDRLQITQEDLMGKPANTQPAPNPPAGK
jgi:hypothetical protein